MSIIIIITDVVIFNKAPVLCDVSAVCLLQGLNKNELYCVSALPDVF